MTRFPSIAELREHLRELQSRSAYQEMITATGDVLAEFEREAKLDEDYGTVLKMHANALLLSCDYAGAEEVYKRGLKLFKQLGLASNMVQCRLRIARCAMWQMDLPRARRLMEELIHELPDGFTLLLHAEAVEVLGRVLLRQHEMAEAIAQLAIARELYLEGGQPYHALVTANNQALACIEHGDYDQAGALLDECYTGLIALGEYRRAWDIRITRAVLLTQQGQLELARQNLLDCFEDVKRYEDYGSHYRLLHQLAVVEILRGDLEVAGSIIKQVLAEPQTKTLPEFEAAVLQLKAVVELLNLNLSASAELVDQTQMRLKNEDQASHDFLVALKAIRRACLGEIDQATLAWQHLDVHQLRESDMQSIHILDYILQRFEQRDAYPDLPAPAVTKFTHWRSMLGKK